MSLPESPKHNPQIESPNVIELSREALAKKLNISEEELPDGKFFKLVDNQLDKLSDAVVWINQAERMKMLKEKLASIDIAEAADKARELGTEGKRLLTSEALEQSTSAVKLATEKLKTEWIAHGKEAAVAVGSIVWAKSIDDVTKWIDGITKVVESTSKTISGAIEWLKNIFSSLFRALGLDKLFKSIWWLFGFGSWDSSDTPKKSDNSTESSTVSDAMKKWSKKLETAEWRKEFVEKISKSLWDKISKTYFWGEKLSDAQMKKLFTILNDSLNTEAIVKVSERLDKGEIQFGELFDATIDMAWTYPAKVMWELSLSGIIPYWAITQHVVVNPAGNLIKLTLDGLGLPVAPISLSSFGSMLEKKAQDADSHALDMARVQLYGVNSILFRTMGEVLGTVVAGGIMLTDTTTRVDGFKNLAKPTFFKDYNTLAGEFWKIEWILNRGSGYSDKFKIGAFGHMLDGVRDIRANALVMDAVAKNTVNGKLDYKKIIDTLDELVVKNPEFGYINTQALKTSINNENSFREALKNLIKWPSSTAGIADAITRQFAKFWGGRTGEALKYLEHIDSVKKWQQSLVGDIGAMSEKLKRLKLSYESLKLARSGDTVILHMENMDDVSKFRSFLSTIPGGIRALSEVIPAASLAISLGSIAWDARDKKDWISGDSLMDVLKTAIVPAYGTWGIIRDKTVNFGKMIADGEMPEFSDMALTGVVGWVFVYEVTRIWSGIIDIKNGNVAKWFSKLTYIHDIGRGFGQVIRWSKNIAALATRPTLRPEFAKWIASIALKMPKKWRLAIGGIALTWLATGLAYAMWEDTPEEIQKQYQKDGYIDEKGNPTEKLRTLFYQKTKEERKEILDGLFILHEWLSGKFPKTYYEEWVYSIVDYNKKWWLIDSPLRIMLQKWGIDINIENS